MLGYDPDLPPALQGVDPRAIQATIEEMQQEQQGPETLYNERPAITNRSIAQLQGGGQIPPTRQQPAPPASDIDRIVEAVRGMGLPPEAAIRILQDRGYTPELIKKQMEFRTLMDQRQNYERDRRLADVEKMGKAAKTFAENYQDPAAAARNSGVNLPGVPYDVQRATALENRRRLNVAEAAERRKGMEDRQREEERLRGPLKPGYAVDPSDRTRQMLVRGGPAWQELSSKHSDDVRAMRSTKDQAQSTVDKISDILDSKNRDAFNSNFGGYNAYITQYYPGATQNTRAWLTSLKDQMKLAGLNLARAGGGSVGAMSEREWPIMERAIESLTPLMDEKEARDTIERVLVRMKRLERNMNEVYQKEWKDSPFYDPNLLKGSPSERDVPEGVPAKVWANMTPREKAQFREAR